MAERLPFLEVPAHALALGDTDVEMLQPFRRADVIASYRGIRGGPHELTKAMTLIAPLLAWLTPQSELVQDDRKSYRTWQYKGRQVLKLRVGSSGHVHLIAGVNYCDPHRGANP